MSGRVLVTGASGFVGRAMVDAARRRRHRVRAATRHPGETRFPAGVEKVATGDYRQPVDWAPLLAGVDSVVHLAGIAHIGPAIGEADYDRVVHAATAELAAACGEAGVRRFVFMSSVRAQSGPAADGVLTENDAPRPTEAYGRAKLRAEAAVRAAGVPWTSCVRPWSTASAPRGTSRALLRLADSPWPLPLAGLNNRRSLVSLDNLIAAVRFVLGADVAARQTYLVADPSPVTLPQIIAALRRWIGLRRASFRCRRQCSRNRSGSIGRGDVWERLGGSLVVDSGKLIAAGWHPEADTLGTLARMAGRMRALDQCLIAAVSTEVQPLRDRLSFSAACSALASLYSASDGAPWSGEPTSRAQAPATVFGSSCISLTAFCGSCCKRCCSPTCRACNSRHPSACCSELIT